MLPVTVRPAKHDDHAALCEVVAATDRFHVALAPHRFQPIAGPARSHAWLASLIEGPEALLLVAERGAAVVGYLEGRVQHSPAEPIHVPRRWLLVDGVGVLEAHRGVGAGRALLEAAHAWARARDLHEVELTVHAANQGALAFYESLGYAPCLHRLSRRV
jgi:ribosomal protein S18 acetylase RimI-like enzyme